MSDTSTLLFATLSKTTRDVVDAHEIGQSGHKVSPYVSASRNYRYVTGRRDGGHILMLRIPACLVLPVDYLWAKGDFTSSKGNTGTPIDVLIRSPSETIALGGGEGDEAEYAILGRIRPEWIVSSVSNGR